MMSHFAQRSIRLMLGLAVVWLGPGLARAAEADLSKCVPPSMTYDEAAALKSCTALLDDDKLPDGERARILTLRGRSFKVEKQSSAAISDFDAALALRPNDTGALVMRGWMAIDTKDTERASAIATQLLATDPGNTEALHMLAFVAHARKDYRAELSYYNKVIALQPNNVLARYNRMIFYKLRGYDRGVVAEADDLLALKTSDLDTLWADLDDKRLSFRAQTRMEQALAWERMGQSEQAEKAFSDWVAAEPGPFSYGNRGVYYYNHEHFEQALADLDKAIAYDPNFGLSHFWRGSALLLTHRDEDAVRAFTRALELNPKSGGSFWLRAMAERRLKRNDAALRDALMAIAIDPGTRTKKADTFVKLGYLDLGPQDMKNPLPALADAVQACMADERCW